MGQIARVANAQCLFALANAGILGDDVFLVISVASFTRAIIHMRVNQIICPECKTSLTSKAGIEVGTSIACPKCKKKFAVAATTKEEEVYEDFEVVDDDEEAAPPKKPAGKKPITRDDEDDEPRSKPVTKKPASRRPVEPEEDDFDFLADEDDAPRKKPAGSKNSARRAADDDEPVARKKARRGDEDDDRPRSKSRGRIEDDDDDIPKSKRRSRDDDDDDDDDRPRRKRRDEDDDDEPKSTYAKMKSNPWIRGSILAVLLAIMGVLGYKLYEKQSKKDDSDSNQKEEDYSKPIKTSPPIEGKKNLNKAQIDDRLVGTWKNSPTASKSETAIEIEYKADGSFRQTINQSASNGSWTVEPEGKRVDEIFILRQVLRGDPERLRIRFVNEKQISHQIKEAPKKEMSYVLDRQ